MGLMLERMRAAQSRSWLAAVVVLCVALRLAALIALPGVFAFDQNGVVHVTKRMIRTLSTCLRRAFWRQGRRAPTQTFRRCMCT